MIASPLSNQLNILAKSRIGLREAIVLTAIGPRVTPADMSKVFKIPTTHVFARAQRLRAKGLIVSRPLDASVDVKHIAFDLTTEGQYLVDQLNAFTNESNS